MRNRSMEHYCINGVCALALFLCAFNKCQISFLIMKVRLRRSAPLKNHVACSPNSVNSIMGLPR